MVYGTQVMWPDHCIQGTADGALHKELNIPHAQLVIRKGYNANVDGYSAFLDLDGKTQTGLKGYLKGRYQARFPRGTRDGFLRDVVGNRRTQTRF